MLKLEDIKKNAAVAGIEPGKVVRIVTTEPVGDSALSVYYKTSDGRFLEGMLYRTDEANLSLAEAGAIFPEYVVLVLILAAAAILRFYALSVPSMWWDEILVPLVAIKPVAYILARTQAMDFHPPYFYLLIKAVTQFGSSDFFLRLPAALAGTVSIYALYRLVWTSSDRTTALLAAAFASGMPLHLLLSREVRPYSLIFLFSCLTLSAGIAYLRQRSPRFLWSMALWNALLGLWHYSGFLFSIANYLFIGLVGLRSRHGRRNALAILTVGGLLSFMPSLFFYNLKTKELMTASFQEVLVTSFTKLYQVLWNDLNPIVVMAVAALFSLGVFRLARNNRLIVAYLLCIIIIPLSILISMGYGSYFNPWHLFALAPVIVLFLANGLAFVLPSRWALGGSLALCLGLFTYHLFVAPSQYYSDSSHTGQYRQWARDLLPFVGSQALWVFQDSSDADGVFWYLKQLKGLPVDIPLPPIKQGGDHFFFMRFNDPLFSGKDGDFLNYFDGISGEYTFGSAKLYALELKRTPDNVISSLPFSLRLHGNPKEMLKHAAMASNITFDPYFGCAVIPFAPRPGRLEYHLVNKSSLRPPYFMVLDIFSRSSYPGNKITIYYRFDDAPWTVWRTLSGSALDKPQRLLLSRSTTFASLDFCVELLASPQAPTMTGNPSGTLEDGRPVVLLQCRGQ